MFAFYNRLGLHVAASDREVIRAIRKRLKPSARRALACRVARHEIMRQTLAEHRRARRLAEDIMEGRI